MRFKRARRVRSAAISFAAIVAVRAAASPAVARVRVPIRPTVDDRTHYGDRNGVESARRAVSRSLPAAAKPGA